MTAVFETFIGMISSFAATRCFIDPRLNRTYVSLPRKISKGARDKRAPSRFPCLSTPNNEDIRLAIARLPLYRQQIPELGRARKRIRGPLLYHPASKQFSVELQLRSRGCTRRDSPPDGSTRTVLSPAGRAGSCRGAVEQIVMTHKSAFFPRASVPFVVFDQASVNNRIIIFPGRNK